MPCGLIPGVRFSPLRLGPSFLRCYALNSMLCMSVLIVCSESIHLGGPVKIRLLELAVSIRLLENNQVATPSQIRETINKLSVLYPDKIYLVPGPDDNLYLSRINLSPKELAL